jgi:hypothetical protein
MTKFICPHCGYDGSRDPRERSEAFLYLEDIQCYREVLHEESRGNTLKVASLYRTGEGFDDGTNGRILCGNCLGEFPVPEDLDVEFV